METTIIVAVTTLVFSVFATIYFRSEIRSLFPRIKTIGRTGVSLSESQGSSKQERKIPFEQQFDVHSRSPVQINQENQLRKELDDRGIVDDAERTKILVRALATTIINAQCERASLLIFGTQLELIVEMNARADGMKLREIEDWYSRTVQPANPDLKDYPFNEYFGFLKLHNLVNLTGEDLRVTQFGVEFMQYLVRNGKTNRRKN